jgi:predicted nuclease of restriction endonuclease-like RecB superfamily
MDISSGVDKRKNKKLRESLEEIHKSMFEDIEHGTKNDFFRQIFPYPEINDYALSLRVINSP